MVTSPRTSREALSEPRTKEGALTRKKGRNAPLRRLREVVNTYRSRLFVLEKHGKFRYFLEEGPRFDGFCTPVPQKLVEVSWYFDQELGTRDLTVIRALAKNMTVVVVLDRFSGRTRVCPNQTWVAKARREAVWSYWRLAADALTA